MYLLFKQHHVLPSEYLKIPPGERMVLKTFLLAECAPKQLEGIRWQAESERMTREEMKHA
ncbi:hypothetical protein RWV98_05845 [Agathobaculum sp. NTUH-O15-33]|uniref:hypothetical protein n=1 Tax=Agathobaculum sp. NTUH-O15-33 TaxID=3079302 RepID=UPI002958B517|nr:hypothetical protein [Agathobaculum sp. NTUH-O15-33]WNX85790.1 hypothetical protein RWV98_05845 [Agathobaculum sp. NTUH-O15-33]